VPVLINENDPVNGNPWGIKFSTMFHMSNDSHLFRTKEQLEENGFELHGNRFVRVAQDAYPAEDITSQNHEVYLPLYEAKMIHQFNHRFGDYSEYPSESLSVVLPEVSQTDLQIAVLNLYQVLGIRN
jgi:hypothetical protein